MRANPFFLSHLKRSLRSIDWDPNASAAPNTGLLVCVTSKDQGYKCPCRRWPKGTQTLAARRLGCAITCRMGVMAPKCRRSRGLWLITFFLSSRVLFSAGGPLPKLYNPGSLLWKPDVSQDPSPESSMGLHAPLAPWGSRIPSITRQDWSLQWTSSGVSAPQHGEKDQESGPWEPGRWEAPPAGSLKVALLPHGQAPGWVGKRSLVVADDAAFRERSKMLAAMERQKWLNSYIQKFLVVNSE